MLATTEAKRAVDLFGVQPKPRNARDRLVITAVELCARKGFNTVGLDEIIDETGVTKTTFYKHFESKDDLIVAAIEQRHEWETAAWSRAVREVGGEDPKAQLLAIFDVMDVWFNDPSFGGCIFLNVAAEFPNPNDPAHIAAAKYKIKQHDAHFALAQKAKLRDPKAFADQFTTLVEGTLILRHVHGRNDAAKMIRPLIEKLLKEHSDDSGA